MGLFEDVDGAGDHQDRYQKRDRGLGIINSLAHGRIAEISVGLNAIEVMNDRCR